MAETEAEKPQTLAEEKVEQEDQGEIPIEAAEDENPTIAAPDEVIMAKADEAFDVLESIETSEQEAVEQTPEIKIETAPADFRFPTTNQTRHCFTRYIEYHRCIAAKGEGASECEKFAKYYRSLCPAEWVERWNEQRENGTFPGPL
eukprot:TRINITY_DN7914_c0_g1_i3.p1 TRINITY_DN7914_c0_g1~~TRINITY_DN7914_c0_g1_i3.p1  ORF type:complete len:146 (-),score=47.65 TRINITY_DN7914_c0_g1_i3:758-1195(-)